MAYDRRVPGTRGVAKLASLVLLWIGAYATLMILFLLFGEQLNPLPLAVRVLLVSAILVIVMSQLVIPLVAKTITRWFGTRTDRRD